jgi:hypothetical protein
LLCTGAWLRNIAQATYSITGGSGTGYFSINATTGAVKVAGYLFIKSLGTTYLTIQVTVTDHGGLTGVGTYTIHIVNVNVSIKI